MKLANTPELRAHRRRIAQADRFHVTSFQVQKAIVRLQDGALTSGDVELLCPPLSSHYKAKKRLMVLRKMHPTAQLVKCIWAFDEDELDARQEFKRSIK
ncbi:hypothetical protein EJD96_16090 [Herbaspirillum seropedicae]|uniref:hypothetical protein n=1 Tax=Herbaspirillum seropedicae TaxID=964 RepID=UPI0011229D13|nr:hypothetical protein [Herbaspirillum seropedicae]QDD65569.1 hypothetical protein EJD96_16090 [Herbaspirillum seropedicae]